MQYAGFWGRLYAEFIDFLIFMPLTVGVFWLHSHSRNIAMLALVLSPILYFSYDIYFHAKFGKTPGKMLARIKVVRPDGSNIGWNEAFKRSSVELSLAIVRLVGQLVALIKISDAAFEQGHSNGMFAQTFTNYILELQTLSPVPSWFTYVEYTWVYSEFITIFFNQKKRALHDFIAGTVVIREDAI